MWEQGGQGRTGDSVGEDDSLSHSLLQQEVAETRPFRWATMTGPSVSDLWAPRPPLTMLPVTGTRRDPADDQI